MEVTITTDFFEAEYCTDVWTGTTRNGFWHGSINRIENQGAEHKYTFSAVDGQLNVLRKEIWDSHNKVFYCIAEGTVVSDGVTYNAEFGTVEKHALDFKYGIKGFADYYEWPDAVHY